MNFKSYDEAVKYLESFIGKVRFEITPEFLKHHDPLTRMRVLLSLLGNPQEKFPSVLIGGTSGKSSTAYLISHILTTAGYKTGFTLSPHLKKINERLQINGKSTSDEKFTEIVGSIVDTIELMKKTKVGAPSYFEILIAMAFLYFAKAKVDIAVVEVGMGGEYDATNTLYPLIAVLTNVSLDHTNVLGGTVQEIARTKVGIIKDHSSLRSLRQFGDSSDPNINQSSSLARAKLFNTGSKNSLFKSAPHAKAPRELMQSLVVVTGVKQPSVIKIVEHKCKKVGTELYRLGKDFDFKVKDETLEGSCFDVTTPHGRGGKLHTLQNLQLALLGKYQVENASLAIETVLQLGKFGFNVSEENIRQALKTAFFPGRFEVVSVVGSQLSVVGNKSIGYQSVSLETDEQKTGKPEAENRKPKTDNRISYALIFDGAHNPTKMKAFLTTLKKLYPKEKKIFVVGFKFDKDVKKMLRQILQVADIVIITEFDRATDMSLSASAEAESIKYKVLSSKYRGKIIVEENSKKALDLALNIPVSQYPNIPAIIVVTGSLYLVGEIRNML